MEVSGEFAIKNNCFKGIKESCVIWRDSLFVYNISVKKII